jgi:hypothetical protein
MIERALVDYYRCPEHLVKMALAGELSADSGYFRFGPSIGYGQTSSGFRSAQPANALYDTALATTTEAGVLKAPYNPPQIVDNLRIAGWTAPTELTFGGRRVQVPRPRVRRTTGGEATLPSVAAFRNRDPLIARMMQQLLAGVSMREYEGSLEARPDGRRTRGSSKSAVSRAVVRRTRQRPQEQLTRRLEGLEIVALFMDGVVIAQQTVIVVLGITRDGYKEPLGLRLGSTENAVVCTELLQDLLARGLALPSGGTDRSVSCPQSHCAVSDDNH